LGVKYIGIEDDGGMRNRMVVYASGGVVYSSGAVFAVEVPTYTRGDRVKFQIMAGLSSGTDLLADDDV
jgi:hypothetical protein